MTSEGFRLGLNYLPSDSFIFFWYRFRPAAIRRDFAWIKERGFRIVRIFLLWEAFQPESRKIETSSLRNLAAICEAAHEEGLKIIVTLFVGHLSGMNLLPPWLLEPKEGKQRFPIYSSFKIRSASILDFFKDKGLREAQRLLVREVANVLQGHPSVFAFDLGNEPSNILLPHEDHFRLWLEDMVEAAKSYDNVPLTLGLHQEDLLRRSAFHPRIVKEYTDFLSIHAYPFYLPSIEAPLDESFPLFLSELTKWLGESEKAVVMEELGAPSDPGIELVDGGFRLYKEEEVEWYLRDALTLLFRSGTETALIWCYSDYERPLWDTPPFDRNVHERFFGLRRFDGREKSYANLARELHIERTEALPRDWINIERDEYFEDPVSHMRRLFSRFKASKG